MNISKKRWAWIGVGTFAIAAGLGALNQDNPIVVAAPTTTVAPATTVAATTTTERATTTTERPTTTVARTTTTEEPYVLTDHDREVIFLAFVRQNTTNSADVDDATIIELARSVCEAFDAGVSWDDLAATAVVTLTQQGQEYLIPDVGVIYGAGIQAFCPEWGWKLEEA